MTFKNKCLFSYIVHIYNEDKSSFHLISRQISTTWILMNESINSLINYQRFWLKPQGLTVVSHERWKHKGNKTQKKLIKCSDTNEVKLQEERQKNQNQKPLEFLL